MANLGLVVGDSAALTPGDINIRDTLLTAHTLSIVSDDDAVPGGVTGIVITESVIPATLGSKYVALNLPMLCLEVGYWDELFWTNSNNVNTGSQSEVNIFSHPITDGVTIPLASAGGMFGTPIGNVTPTANIFMTSNSVAFPNTHALGWAIEQGRGLFSGNSLRRNVAISIINNAAANLNAEGQQIILQSVSWMLTPVTPSFIGGVFSIPIHARRSVVRKW